MYSKNYKENSLAKNMKRIGKKGQVTIFVIVAIVLVALIVLFFFFRPNVETFFGEAFSPNQYLRDCIEPEVRNGVELLSKQGSYKAPEGIVNYQGERFTYLCYTDDYYETCVVQQPMIKNNFEKELNSILVPRADQCMRNLISEYRKRNYEVSSGGIKSNVAITPGKILVTFDSPITVKKDTSQTFKNFELEIDSEIYDLLFISSSIIEYESGFGDSASELYLQYYPNLKIEKTKLSDGTTIYKISDVVSGEQFNFASRSVAWPPGYEGK